MSVKQKYLKDEKDAYTIFLYNNDNVTQDDMYNFQNAMHKDKTKIVVTYTNKIQEMEKWIECWHEFDPCPDV